MTDNMKSFMEEASRDKGFSEKLSMAQSPEEVIALAKEKGFTITMEELAVKPEFGELDEDEQNAVAGGTGCGCFLGGGGGDGCVCVFGGMSDTPAGGGTFPDKCFCFLVGGGSNDAI